MSNSRSISGNPTNTSFGYLLGPSSTLPVGSPRPGTTQQLSAPEDVCAQEQFQSFVAYPPYNDNMSFEEVRFNDYHMRLGGSTPSSPQLSSPTNRPMEGCSQGGPPNLEGEPLEVEQPSPTSSNPRGPSTLASPTSQEAHPNPKASTDAPDVSPTNSTTDRKDANARGQALTAFPLAGCPAAQTLPVIPGWPTRSYLSLLHGPVVKVMVGNSGLFCSESEMCSHVTYLPKALLIYHSPFLKVACSGQFKEAQEKTIRLPQDSPKIFEKFVEWMYYNSYSPGSCWDDANTWVLGDKLLVVRFMNHAMGRIYAAWTVTDLIPKLDPSLLSYVLNNTMPGSKLRLLFLDILRTSYAHPDRLTGDTDSWDEVLLEHDDARKAVLEVCTKKPNVGTFIKALGDYMTT